MKVVIPLAGRGSRFAAEGIQTPKPLISVAGRPMLSWALQSLEHVEYSQIIFVGLAEHESEHGLIDQLHRLAGTQVEIILLDGITEGQLCTVLAARPLINTDEDLLIASADTLVISNLGQAIARRPRDCHGIISVADMPGERWSFVRADASGRATEVAEKVRISDHASTGLYYFSSGKEFVEVADDMIRNNEKTRGEYYVIPVYQKYIARDWRVDVSVARTMWDMGTPDALSQFQLSLQERDRIATGI